MAISGSNEYSAFADCRGKSNIRRFVTDDPGLSQVDVELLRGLKDQMWQWFSAHAFVIWGMWADVNALNFNICKIQKLVMSSIWMQMDNMTLAKLEIFYVGTSPLSQTSL